LERRLEAGTGQVEQGTKQPWRIGIIARSHSSQTSKAAGPSRPDQQRFRLVAGVVGDEEMENRPFTAPFAKQAIARLTRLRLNPPPRLGTCPGQRKMFDSAFVQPATNHCGLMCGGRSKAMIDGQRDNAPTPPDRPFLADETQAEAIRTA
jgi:hypothetical protein